MVEENYNDYSQDTAVIMGIQHSLTKEQILPNLPSNINKVVVYQTEPLVKNHWHNSTTIIEKLSSYDEVWEFDYDNYLLLLENGINVKFAPVKYTHSLKKINSKFEPDIDILFYGASTKHRNDFFCSFPSGFAFPTADKNYINRFKKLSIVCLNGIDDSRLDEFISRSKIILNLQPHKQENDEDRQSQVRMFYPLINEKCIVSEKSKRNYFGNTILEFSNHQELGEIVMDLILNDKWRDYPTKCSDYERFVNREILMQEGL